MGFIWISVSQGPSELSVIERCPCYRGVLKERFDCSSFVKRYWLTSRNSAIEIKIIIFIIFELKEQSRSYVKLTVSCNFVSIFSPMKKGV